MRIEKYEEQQKRLPRIGNQLIGYKEENNIIVYQAFNPGIAAYAAENQQFGGLHYSFNRMSWIKPGFLWMMHRSGWALKSQQERILAITLPVVHLKKILQEATFSTFNKNLYDNEAAWRLELDKTEVRLQWDPDHDPHGNKQERKAIQLGLKGDILKVFSNEWIIKIEDITCFVQMQHLHIQRNELELLELPFEEVIRLDDMELERKIELSI